MSETTTNVDPQEVGKFDEQAARWWDPEGELKPLHRINPLRLDYIERRAGLAGQRVLDVGCGGGLLAEAMARRGATVTGIDMAAEALRVARAHAAAQEVAVTYERATPEEYATRHPEAFDVVVCLELLEHVPDPAAVVAACARLARPGGQVIFSTLNRNPKSYLLAIVGAEYLLDLIPRGTHDYARFIRPSELAGWARGAGLMTVDLTGLLYNPLTRTYRLGADVDVNYLAHCTKEA